MVEPVDRPAIDRREGPGMANGTILVADDDAAIRTVLNQALARAGYDVRSTGLASTLWRWIAPARGISSLPMW
jgi:DNA-binding NtrC family response regulator